MLYIWAKKGRQMFQNAIRLDKATYLTTVKQLDHHVKNPLHIA